MPEPPPQVLAFVIDPGDKMVVLGRLSPDQVRALFQELREQRLAHTGNGSSALLLIALVTLISGGALIGLTTWRRRTTA